MLDRLIPNLRFVASHPMYRVEARRLRQRSIENLAVFSMNWFLRIAGFVLVLWALFVAERWLRYGITDSQVYFVPVATQTSADIMQLVFFISLGLNIILDFISVLVSVNSISHEKVTATWDLIQLTKLSPFGVIRTKHTLAQLRAWRSMMVVTSLRLIVIVILFLHSLLLPNSSFTRQSALSGFWDYFWRYPFESTLQLLMLAVVALVFVLEPIWRMQAVTAMTVAISARGWRTTTSLMAGFASVLFMWISQAIILGFIFWLTVMIGRTAINISFSNEVALIIALMYIAMLGTVITLHYRFLREWSLRNAARAAFRT